MKKHYLMAAGFWLAVSFSAFAQSQQSEQRIFPTNTAALKQLHDKAQKQYAEGMIKARLLADSLGIPMRQVDKNGRVRQVTGVDELGNLQITETDNVVSAASIGTTRVWPLSGNGFNLTGKSFRAHEWDGGAVRTTHVEFGGRVRMGDNSSIDFHPTHVAGTIIASGVNGSVRGMAYEAFLTAFDFGNHTAEMSSIAEEMLVSNHSYGTIGGWRQNGTTWEWMGIPSVSETLDPKFGVYDQVARDWDVLSYSAPYYLIVKSAGNSRNDGPGPGTNHRLPYAGGIMSTTTRPKNGPYDILATYTTAKNILTIAAVEDVPNGYVNPASVGMSNFSSWGPTDDGRIKPDISTNGVGVLSTSDASDNAYANADGTSMASPAATGSLILLQQHYFNQFGGQMLSSLLKALVCHTADETGGAEGPDYAFGWGLMNTHKAATTINQHGRRAIVEAKNLVNNGVETINVYATGRGPLTATIAWTDPAGAAVLINVLNNRTPRLVNDLDLRIIGPGGAVTLPYTLDFAIPQNPAVKADNIRDNVEKVFLANPVAGNYQIRISHKGSSLTTNAQAYGLIVTGIATADTAITCSGNYIFNATTGIFTDGSAAAPYSNNLNCNWLIDLKDTAASLRLKFDQLTILAGDTVYLYNGINASAPLIGKYSGNTAPPAWLGASADRVFVRFMSNASGNAAGWTLRYSSGIRPKALLRTPGSPYSCTNRNLIFSTAPLIPDTTGWRYNWTFLGAITPNYTTPSVAVSYAQAGIYGYKLVITNIAGRSITYQEDSVVWVRPNVGKVRSRFSEGFENANFPLVSNQSDSIFEILGNEYETWQRTTEASQSGIASMVVKNFGTTASTVRELILPSINMTTLRAPFSLRYFIAHAAETTTATDRLRILVSTDCGQNWTQRGSRSNNATTSPLYTVQLPITGGYIPASTDWRRDTLNLIAYQNSINLMIKFEMSGDMSDNLYLDNITIGNQVTSNKSRFQNTQTWMRATPNPYAQQLSIAYQIPTAGKVTLKLVDMLGRSHLVEQTYRSVGEHETQLPESLTSLPTGLYILRLEGDGFISNLKVVKK